MKSFRRYIQMKEEGQTLSNVKFGEPSPKQYRVMQKEHSLFEIESDESQLSDPPTNESEETRVELMELQDRLDLEKNSQELLEKWDTDLTDPFIDYLRKNNLSFQKSFIDNLIDDSKVVILKQKYIFNRPRPDKLAPLIGMKLTPIVSKTADSPAYPSGHAAQARLIALYLAGVHPDHSERFFEMARECGESRLNAGVHYPSDYIAGVKLANKMYDSMTVKEKIQYKDLPAHVGGMEGY